MDPLRGLRIYRSNSMEQLAEALGDVVSAPLDEPFAAECILVPGRGVAQWLGMQLCERFGVSANVLYLYPRNFVGWALDRVLAKPGEALEAFDPDKLLWSLFGTLEPLLGLPEFASVQRYVAGDPTRVRYFELCRRIALTFDRYVTYRPDLLRSWERSTTREAKSHEQPQLGLFAGSGDTQSWQPILWRALVRELGPAHSGTLERRFLSQLKRAKRLSNLPARICCLGLTHLPPSYTRILVALCPHVPVHMFQLQATAAVRKSGARAAAQPKRSNPLVQSLGTLAADFEAVLESELQSQAVSHESVPLDVAPHGESRLSELQREILEDRPPRRSPVRPNDDSIRIHVCHSPMREVEVLHDQLLALLASGGGLEPRDVVVMMPDVEIYAPLIEAVFRRRADDPHRIPYSIADRALTTAAPVTLALTRVFALASERLSASQLLDLLALEVVASRFEITPKDIERMTEWLTAANVRWGKDAEHRAAHGHPRSEANTWRQGLWRLLLGYAVQSDGTELCLDTLPEPGAEGAEASALGKLARFVETLFGVLEAFATPQSAEAWVATVGSALDALVHSDPETAWQHQEVRDALTTLATRATAAGYSEVISGPAFSQLLFDTIDAARPSRGFLTGGVTFCSMVPLRSVPFRVICLMGLGDGEFPRRETATDFDLISRGPESRRIGDRSRRIEDRYVFLEAILSARERLIVTFVGQSIRDNSLLPPSVLVGELCDYLGADSSASALESGDPTGLIVRHPLQAFSPRYFDGSDERLFSHAIEYLEGARTRGVSRSRAPEFFSEPLGEPESDGALALGDLVRFYQNPTEYLLNRRLELFLREGDFEVPNREPQELSPLDLYAVGDRLLALTLRGVPVEQARRLIAASGALPLGTPGELDFVSASASAAPIAQRVLAARSGERRPPLVIAARLPSGASVTGTLPESFDGSIIEAQFARVRARHLIGAWIRHLGWCAAAPAYATQTSLFGRPEEGEGVQEFRFRKVADAAAELDVLASHFRTGQRLPLPFLPSVALHYVEYLRRGKPAAECAYFAERGWASACKDEPHLRRVFGGAGRLLFDRHAWGGAPEFAALAQQIAGPLLDHMSTPEIDA